MANHARKQIRDAAVAALQVGTGWNLVHASRVPPAVGQFPMLLVYADGEGSEDMEIHANPTLERVITLTVEAVALMNLRDSATTEDDLDAMAKEVEEIMAAADIGKGTTLTGTEFELVYDQNDQPSAGTIRLRYSITYYTQSGTPDVLV